MTTCLRCGAETISVSTRQAHAVVLDPTPTRTKKSTPVKRTSFVIVKGYATQVDAGIYVPSDFDVYTPHKCKDLT